MDKFYFVFASYEEANAALPKFASDVAVKLRQEAVRAREREEESFQRCDTDGFLSQWALGIGAQERERQATLQDNGCLVIRPALADIETGEIVAACIHLSPSQFSPGGTDFQWKVYKKRDQWNWFWCGDAKRESTFEKKGLKKVFVMAPGKMYSKGPGNHQPEARGLSGCASYHGKFADIDYEASGLPL
jgi:hypothetical protein